jgi:MerR family transcriptional regulator, copper efflux regulator
MRISELSRRCGIPASTLRYYEDVGLLPATERSPSGYRLYDDHARQRLMFIEAAKRLRLSLSSIGDLLEVWESDTCRTVKNQLRPALDDRIAEADSAIADLRLLREQLVGAQSRLDDSPDRDQPCDPDCSFLLDDQKLSLGMPGSASEQTIACSLDGEQYRERTEQWQQILQSGARSRVAGGVEVMLPGERASELVALIQAERTCCSFLDFTLRFVGSAVVLTLTAPDHAQQIVSNLTNDGTSDPS